MKCFILLALASVASAQYYLPDTAEVAAAKQAHFAAHQAALAQAGAPYAAPVAPVQAALPVAAAAGFEDGQSYPAAEPYVHVEIPAEPYQHVEVAAEPYVHLEPAYHQQAAPAPVQPAAPVLYSGAPVYAASACFNYKGEGVPCRH